MEAEFENNTNQTSDENENVENENFEKENKNKESDKQNENVDNENFEKENDNTESDKKNENVENDKFKNENDYIESDKNKNFINDNFKKDIFKKKNFKKENDKEENKKINYFRNKSILLIFNKLSDEYDFNIKSLKVEKKPKIEEKILNEEYKFIDSEKITLLIKELEKSSFNDLLKEDESNRIIESIIKDYYIYFLTRNESLERETNDLNNLSQLLEMFCEFQFNFKKKRT